MRERKAVDRSLTGRMRRLEQRHQYHTERANAHSRKAMECAEKMRELHAEAQALSKSLDTPANG